MLFCLCSVCLSETYEHNETGLLFRDKIHGFTKTQVVDHEKNSPGYGVGVGYKKGNIAATIYIYRMGHKFIPDNIDSDVVLSQLNNDIREIISAKNAGYYDLVNIEKKDYIYLDHDKKQKAHRVLFSISYENRELLSYLYLTVYKKHFFKIRYTYDKHNKYEADMIFSQLLSGIGIYNK